MRSSLARWLWMAVPVLLGGCCSLFPCHPSTYIVGTVRDAVSDGVVPGATIRLYHYETRSSMSGCFSLGGADALPFEFAVTAPGYEPLLVEAEPGFFRAVVALVPVGAEGESEAKLDDISRKRYDELARSCP